MEKKILDFVNLLRKNEIPISLSESIDCFHAVSLMGLEKREVFKNCLRATLIKKSKYIPMFNMLFKFYFSSMEEILQSADQDILNSIVERENEQEIFLRELEEVLGKYGQASPLTVDFLISNADKLADLLQNSGLSEIVGKINSGYQDSFLTHRILMQLGWKGIDNDIKRFKEWINQSNIPDGRIEKFIRYIDEKVESLPKILKEYLRHQRSINTLDAGEKRFNESLLGKDFFSLTKEEKDELQRTIKILASKLKSVTSVKRKIARYGRLNLKKTIRKNIQYGGVFWELIFDKKKIDKPQIVLLCDVSNSVRYASRFMLQFVYCLQELYSKVRSFIFVSDLEEITGLFKEKGIDEAVELALRNEIADPYYHTDYGNSLLTFYENYFDSVNRKTAVIILGDARSNYSDPEEWTLREIKSKAKKIIWLNPERRASWRDGDCVMGKYAPFCDAVLVVRTVDQLFQAVDRLTLQI